MNKETKDHQLRQISEMHAGLEQIDAGVSHLNLSMEIQSLALSIALDAVKRASTNLHFAIVSANTALRIQHSDESLAASNEGD